MQIFDGSSHVAELGQASGVASKEKVARPKALFAHQHRDEGFALDWSRLSQARLASGDNKASLYVWDPSSNASSWTVKQYKASYIADPWQNLNLPVMQPYMGSSLLMLDRTMIFMGCL